MAFCPGTASKRVKVGKPELSLRISPTKEGLVDGQEIMYLETIARTMNYGTEKGSL